MNAKQTSGKSKLWVSLAPLCSLVIVSVLILAIILTIALPAQSAQAAGDNGAGYWYRVQRGDSWYRIAAKTGVSVQELWRANPTHIRHRYILYVGEQLWIPQAIGCPPDFADYPSAIGQMLDASDGNLTQLGNWLRACNVQTQDLGTVRQYALHDVSDGDVAVSIYDFTTDPNTPHGVLLVYHRTGGFVLAHQASGEGKAEFRAITDLNDDGRREIMWTDTTCGAHTCFSTLYVDQWDGAIYRDWILGKPQMATTEYSIGEVSSAGAGAEITVHGGAIGSVGAGPVRTWSEVYGSPPDRPYELLATVLDPSPCFYHHLLEANKLYDQSSIDPAGYAAAISAYNDLLADPSMQACAYADLPNELDLLADFARFRLVVSHSAQGDVAAANTTRNQIGTPVIQGAADIFLTNFNATSDLAQACADTTVYAAANPASWNYLADWGYGNPSFSAAQFCAGAGSISGVVWNDFCTIADPGNALLANSGCVEQAGVYKANGIREAGETALAGVTLTLVNRQCSQPGDESGAWAISAGDGRYAFSGLEPSDYCVEIDLDTADNTSILVPGDWTQPAGSGGAVIGIDVPLAPGQEAQQIDFGWDFQFD